MHKRQDPILLHTNRFMTGLWTQRNPLRDAATTYLLERSQGGRFDSIIDGLNVEMTSRLTVRRRRGTGVYNSQTFDPVNRFYEFRRFSTSTAIINVIADTAAAVYDATGPNTKQLLFTKSAGAGSSKFQSVGNRLFFGNGVDRKKWLQSARSWLAAHTFTSGQFIVDTNLNLQLAMGARSAQAINAVLTANVCTLTFPGKVALLFFAGMQLPLTAFTGAYAFLNGNTATVTSVSYNQITFAFVHANVASTAITGTVQCAGGNTGGVQPAWGIVKGNVTADGAEQWLCLGSSIQNFGGDAPSTKPSVANATRPSVYPLWAANTVYAPIVIGAAFVHQLTTSGTTGGVEPAWNVVVGGTTNDNTAQWTNVGSATRANLTAYALGRYIRVTWSQWITIPGGGGPCFSGSTKLKGGKRFDELPEIVEIETMFGVRRARVVTHAYDGEVIDLGNDEFVTPDHRFYKKGEWVRAKDAFPNHPRKHFAGTVYNLSIFTNREEERHYILENGEIAHNISAGDGSGDYSYEVTYTAIWKAVVGGVSGASEPAWQDGTGAQVQDGTVTWQNVGASLTWAANVGAATLVSTATSILDSNGNIQALTTPGKSGAVAPTWATTLGQATVDNAARWSMNGVFASANTSQWIYGYSYRNSLDQGLTNMSPESDAIVLAANSYVLVQGVGPDDPQYDEIVIWRIAQGGSTFLELDSIAAPAAGVLWSYSDTSADSALIEESAAEFDNNAPPDGITNLSFHMQRVWGTDGNTLYYSWAPLNVNGDALQAFSPSNNFVFDAEIKRLWPTPIGLLVFTMSDVYIVLGKGTSASGFYAVKFIEGLGIGGYDAFSVLGSTAYLMTGTKKVVSLDPGAGVTEVGFPIGDQFEDLYDASAAYVTWHEGGSGDSALYVADGTVGWFRMSPMAAPESGTMVWSPRAVQTGGCKAVQSVEVTPGVKKLLVGPKAGTTGPIEMRDTTVNTDNLTPFAANVTFGSIILAHGRQVAEIDSFTTDSVKVGTRPTIGLRFDEISGDFDRLYRSRQDPVHLPPSNSLFNDRYYTNQNHKPGYCRHFQLQFSWAAEDAANELLSYSTFGALYQEKI